MDENVDPGRYGFRIDHDHDKTHYFSSDEKAIVRDWMKAIMKATIDRDYSSRSIYSVYAALFLLTFDRTCCIVVQYTNDFSHSSTGHESSTPSALSNSSRGNAKSAPSGKSSSVVNTRCPSPNGTRVYIWQPCRRRRG